MTTTTDTAHELRLERDADDHWRWTRNPSIRTTDRLVEAQRSAAYRSTCPGHGDCVNPAHQRTR